LPAALPDEFLTAIDAIGITSPSLRYAR
jgi:hypothetical protein